MITSYPQHPSFENRVTLFFLDPQSEIIYFFVYAGGEAFAIMRDMRTLLSSSHLTIFFYGGNTHDP